MFKERFKKLYFYRLVLWDMSVSLLKAKYAGSYLGLWWAVVAPLILTMSISFVFTYVFKIQVKNFALFVLSGILPWLFFSSSLLEASNSFVSGSAILRQSMIPREFIPLSSVISNLLNFLIGLLFLLPLFLILNFGVLTNLPILLLVVMFNFVFVLGLGLLFSTLNIFLKDTVHFLSAIFTVWFWITPVFYSLNDLSFPFSLICLLNPMTYYVLGYQSILFQAKSPQPLIMLILLILSVLSLLAGYVFFVKKESALLKRI